MSNQTLKRSPILRSGTPSAVGVAVALALYGQPYVAKGQDAQVASQALQEVVVTATRVQQSIESVPFSLTALSPAELRNSNITDLQSLTKAVPNLSMFQLGARFAAGEVPIMRGLSADSTPRGTHEFEQSPVSIYIENSPIDGYFQLGDLQRVEILRGPQGTLYGSGALGGAIRFIPNSPQLRRFEGSLSLEGGVVAHSSDRHYGIEGMVNVPIGDTLAFRAWAKYDYSPGFIDVYGILERSKSDVQAPLLADPVQPVTSPGIFYGKSDWNSAKNLTGRVSLRWRPDENFNAELAFFLGHLIGDGVDFGNTGFLGGPYPLSPSVIFPAGGPYRDFSAIDEPYERTTGLSSLDLSYDFGFATLSSTTSYFTNRGATVDDGETYIIAGFPIPEVRYYYAGNPVNPRYIGPQVFSDVEKTFTQEVRLVSRTGRDRHLDYVIGLFLQKQFRDGSWVYSAPGTPEYAVAEGCTAFYSYDASFPNCLVNYLPNDVGFEDIDNQYFKERSIYADLTWHFNDRLQITGGARYARQTFTDSQLYLSYPFQALIPATPSLSSEAMSVGKVNPSFEYAKNHYVYLMWSQGFRRAGANSFPLAGFFAEPQQLLNYKPDRVNNYEIGFKGRFSNGIYYSLAVFDDLWDNPQSNGTLASGNVVVFNADKAESTGFELESQGPLVLAGLSYSIGIAYADARLTKDFSLPANNGAGQIVPGGLTGKAGTPLPGSPKTSATVALTYRRNVASGYDASVSANAIYRSRIPNELGPLVQPPSDSYLVENLSAAVYHGRWQFSAYVNNVLDKRVVLSPPLSAFTGTLDGLTDESLINRPREMGVRVSYNFESGAGGH